MAFAGVEIEKWNKDLQRNAEEGDADRDLIPVKLIAISDEVVVNEPTNGEGKKRKYQANMEITTSIKVHKKADGKYVWSTDTNENGIWDEGQEYITLRQPIQSAGCYCMCQDRWSSP